MKMDFSSLMTEPGDVSGAGVWIDLRGVPYGTFLLLVVILSRES